MAPRHRMKHPTPCVGWSPIWVCFCTWECFCLCCYIPSFPLMQICFVFKNLSKFPCSQPTLGNLMLHTRVSKPHVIWWMPGHIEEEAQFLVGLTNWNKQGEKIACYPPPGPWYQKQNPSISTSQLAQLWAQFGTLPPFPHPLPKAHKIYAHSSPAFNLIILSLSLEVDISIYAHCCFFVSRWKMLSLMHDAPVCTSF